VCTFVCKMFRTGVSLRGRFPVHGIDFDAFVDFVLALRNMFLYRGVFVV